MKKNRLLLKHSFWILLTGVLLFTASGCASITFARSPTQTPSPYQTALVRRGSLSLSASGSGTLTAGKEMDLGFPISGTLAEVNVEVGDQVSAGDVLAVLDGTDELNLDVQTKELALESAQQAIDDLKQNASEALSQAQLTLADAKAAYADAEANLHQKGDPRCEQSLTQTYYYQYLHLQGEVNEWQSYLSGGSGYGKDYILSKLEPLREQLDLAYINWKYCEGYTDQEIADSQATLQLAEKNMQQAQAQYQNLADNGGIDPDQLALDEANVQNAQLQLSIAKANLAGATLIAPMDGTVTTLAAGAGEPAGTGTFITLSDLQHPVINFSIDESDLQNVKVDCPANIVFDAIPDRTFMGTVTEVLPELASDRGASVVQGTADLQGEQLASRPLVVGMSASVEVVCGQATNVLMAPAEAVNQLANGTSVVYVLNSLGQPEEKPVEIGLSDGIYTEIRSGLSEGEQVITAGLETP